VKYKHKQYNTMLVDVTDGIAVLRFNRPEAMNAANVEMSFERLEILRGLAADDGVRAVIYTGNEKAYCAGGDLEAFSQFGVAQAQAFARRGLDYQNLLADMPKPVIAAVAGFCLGGGLENMLMSDLRIAADNARFGLPEINVGIFPGGGGTQRLSQNLPVALVKEMVFLGRTLDAEEALRFGLVNKVVPLDQLMPEAVSWAQRLLKKPALALKAAKTAVNASYSTDLQTGLALEGQSWAALYGTRDQKEGMKAFLEKRKPEFTGE
jgi:enoyl-CoA hydratase